MTIGAVLVLGACGQPSAEDVATAYWDSPTLEQRLELVADDAVFTSAAGVDYRGKDAIRQLYTAGPPATLQEEPFGSPQFHGNTVTFEERTYPKGLTPPGEPLDPGRAYHIEITMTIEHGKITRHVVRCVEQCGG